MDTFHAARFNSADMAEIAPSSEATSLHPLQCAEIKFYPANTQLSYSTDLLVFSWRNCSHRVAWVEQVCQIKGKEYMPVLRGKHLFVFSHFPLHVSLALRGNTKMFVIQQGVLQVKSELCLLLLTIPFWLCKALWDLAGLNVWVYWELEMFRDVDKIFPHCVKLFFLKY